MREKGKTRGKEREGSEDLRMKSERRRVSEKWEEE